MVAPRNLDAGESWSVLIKTGVAVGIVGDRNTVSATVMEKAFQRRLARFITWLLFRKFELIFLASKNCAVLPFDYGNSYFNTKNAIGTILHREEFIRLGLRDWIVVV